MRLLAALNLGDGFVYVRRQPRRHVIAEVIRRRIHAVTHAVIPRRAGHRQNLPNLPKAYKAICGQNDRFVLHTTHLRDVEDASDGADVDAAIPGHNAINL